MAYAITPNTDIYIRINTTRTPTGPTLEGCVVVRNDNNIKKQTSDTNPIILFIIIVNYTTYKEPITEKER